MGRQRKSESSKLLKLKRLKIKKTSPMSQNRKKLEKIKAVQGKDMTDQVKNNKIEERERIVKVASKKKSKKIVRPIPNANGQQAKRYIGYNVMDANFGFIYIALVSNQNRSQRTKISFVKLVNPTVKTRGKRGRTTKNNLA